MTRSSSPESEDSDSGNPARPRAKTRLPGTLLLLNRQRAIRADWSEVSEFLGQLGSRLAGSSFSVCLLSDRGIRRYNRRFRHRNEATDVLSFPAGGPQTKKTTRTSYLGDILISAETARESAQRHGLRVEEEIKILALHGLLHLLGYDHESDRGQMARLERRWSSRLKLPQTLTGRSRRARGAGPASSRAR